ncbi:unnamed protein product [Amaranthus hypochondriacus]
MHHHLLLLLLTIFHLPSLYFSDCRSQCGSIPIHYPLSIDDGCGAPQFRNMFTCNISSTSLFFITPNGNYKVQSIDYKTQTLTVYDPDMSTCTVLQPHHDIHLSDIQYAIIPPSPDTIFALLNCSIDSPILHRFSDLCFDFASHKCQELYSSCNSFRVFTTGLVNPGLTNNPPPCCFTGYSTVKVMSMDILDCTHYTSFYDADKLRGVGPMDWSYGLKFSYSVPDMGCERCTKSGGNCGFDVQTEALLCLCPGANNSTRQCGNDIDAAGNRVPSIIVICLAFMFFLS